MQPDRVIKPIDVEISDEEKLKKVNELLKIDAGDQQLVQVILVLLGKKPVTDLSIHEHNSNSQQVEKILRDVGLYFIHSPNKLPNARETYYISRNESLLEEMQQVDSRYEPRKFGELMGFPPTAINAFMNGTLDVTIGDRYPELIFNMGYSKDHWKEEVEIVRGWSDEIKKYAPGIYETLHQMNLNKQSESDKKG